MCRRSCTLCRLCRLDSSVASSAPALPLSPPPPCALPLICTVPRDTDSQRQTLTCSCANDVSQTIGCTDRHCSSSLMNWKHQSSRSPRSLDDLVTAAQHFLDQYYSSIKRLNSPGHELRWKEVLNEILSTGSYELKETELIFGAKLAWRNASRCIGRIQWSKLQVGHPPSGVQRLLTTNVLLFMALTMLTRCSHDAHTLLTLSLFFTLCSGVRLSLCLECAGNV